MVVLLVNLTILLRVVDSLVAMLIVISVYPLLCKANTPETFSIFLVFSAI